MPGFNKLSADYKFHDNSWFYKLPADGQWHPFWNMFYKETDGMWHPVWLYSWQVTGWTACTAPCNTGEQERSAYCLRSDNMVMADAFCDGLAKPPIRQYCNQQPCQWISTAWSDCSMPCGGGLLYRTVYCTDGYGNWIDEGWCWNSAKPESTWPCNPQACVNCTEFIGNIYANRASGETSFGGGSLFPIIQHPDGPGDYWVDISFNIQVSCPDDRSIVSTIYGENIFGMGWRGVVGNANIYDHDIDHIYRYRSRGFVLNEGKYHYIWLEALPESEWQVVDENGNKDKTYAVRSSLYWWDIPPYILANKLFQLRVYDPNTMYKRAILSPGPTGGTDWTEFESLIPFADRYGPPLVMIGGEFRPGFDSFWEHSLDEYFVDNFYSIPWSTPNWNLEGDYLTGPLRAFKHSVPGNFSMFYYGRGTWRTDRDDVGPNLFRNCICICATWRCAYTVLPQQMVGGRFFIDAIPHMMSCREHGNDTDDAYAPGWCKFIRR